MCKANDAIALSWIRAVRHQTAALCRQGMCCHVETATQCNRPQTYVQSCQSMYYCYQRIKWAMQRCLLLFMGHMTLANIAQGHTHIKLTPYVTGSPDLRAQCTAACREPKLGGLCRNTFIMWGREDIAVPSTTSITTRPCRLAISCTGMAP